MCAGVDIRCVLALDTLYVGLRQLVLNQSFTGYISVPRQNGLVRLRSNQRPISIGDHPPEQTPTLSRVQISTAVAEYQGAKFG